MSVTEMSLGQKIKEAGTHTVIYGLGSVLQSALGFLLIPLYTSYYTTEMYGALALISMCGAFAGAVFFLGASSALARSYYDYDDLEERKRVASTTMLLSLGGAFLQVSVGMLFSESLSIWLFNTTNYALHIVAVLVSTAVAFVNNVFYMLLRFHRLSRHVVFINIFTLLLSAGLILYLLVVMEMGIFAPIVGTLLSNLFAFVFLYCVSRKFLIFGYSKKELSIQLKYGIQVVFVGLAYYSFDWINRYFLNKFCSLSDVGIYSLGFQIGSAINILFVLPFCQIWAPMRMEYRNQDDADDLYKKILSYYFLVCAVITTITTIFAKDLIMLLSWNKDFIESYLVVPFIMFGLSLYGSINIIDNGIYFSRKIIYHAYIFWAVSIVALVLNLIFIKRYSYIGAAAIIAFCYTLVFAIVFFISNNLYKINVEKGRLTVLLGLSLISVAIAWLIEIPSFMLAVFVKTAVASGFIFGIYILVLTPSEKRRLFNLFKRCPT